MADPSQEPHFTLILNAGGQSRRMGTSKSTLPTPPDNRPLIAHVAAQLAALPLAGIVVVTNETGAAARYALPSHARFVADHFPGAGTAGGIATGLGLCSGWALVLACDLPLVQAPVVRLLWQLAQEQDAAGRRRWDAVVPVVHGWDEPLHAFYHAALLPALIRTLETGRLRANAVLDFVRTRRVHTEELRTVSPDLASFTNVNTPAEWARVRGLLADRAAGSPHHGG